MSSMRVIWLKTSTLLPSSLALCSSLSSTLSLALLSIRCSPSMKGGPGSCPSKRYGWFAHLRSCITMLSRRDRSPPLPLMASTSFFRMLAYSTFCILDMGRYMLISVLAGRPFSTSALSLRRRKGRRILKSLLVTSSAFSDDWKKLSKSSASLNSSGSRKLRSAHSSCRLFCSGVPVRRILCLTVNRASAPKSCDLSFLSLWPSSTTIVSQSIRERMFASPSAFS
mmetsp:Transcript_59811/g.146983  ORF Transcript_59811/g.146983 Transcript_59811/m.146983 type:complete len:225 (+) Transcript_59811:1871-2545(+)